MSWGSLGARLFAYVVVLPLALRFLSTEVMAIWLVLGVIASFQMVADLGFSSTFTRIVAYALGGRDVRTPAGFNGAGIQGHRAGTPDPRTLAAVVATMRILYRRLAVGALLIIGSGGTWVLMAPIAGSGDPASAWLAWGITLGTLTIGLYGNLYGAFLQGTNQVALQRRWEMYCALGAGVTDCTALLLGGGLLALVASNQAWVIVNVLINRRLAFVTAGSKNVWSSRPRPDWDIIRAVWPPAWRSAIGVGMSFGLIQGTALAFARLASPVETASYLLALRLIQTISAFSQAPFYSKLPLLARLNAEGKSSELINIARRGMMASYWTFTLGVVCVGLGATAFLDAVGSNTRFVDVSFWGLLGIAFFVERVGAMHIQLYSTTNHIVWHIATGVTGAMYLFAGLILFPLIGAYAMPVAMLIGYLGFYLWYATYHSCRAFRFSFGEFERRLSALPFVILLLFEATATLTIGLY